MKAKLIFLIILVVLSLQHDSSTFQKKQKHNHDHHHHSHHHSHQHDHHHHHHHHAPHPQVQIVEQEKVDNRSSEEKIEEFLKSCEKEVGEWISGRKIDGTEKGIEKCQIKQISDKLIELYETLARQGQNFIKIHIDKIIEFFKKNPQVKPALQCLVDGAQKENKYFLQKRKYKYLSQFVRQHPRQAEKIFPKIGNWKQKGQRVGQYLKALFQYYYLYVLNPSQTLSTEFIRALTVRSNIFNHQDIAYCLSLETVGKLTTSLQDLDINNIYLRIPQIFNSLRYLKFKHSCSTQSNLNIMRQVQNRWKKLDMFKIMYSQYEPFVQIAAERFTQSQIRMLARKFSSMWQNSEHYEKLSQKQEDEL